MQESLVSAQRDLAVQQEGLQQLQHELHVLQRYPVMCPFMG